jgi:NAD-reducing hydrogenase large subunit
MKVVINPVTRVEGHGKVTIQMDNAGKVTQARFHIVEFRGFERFVQGRLYWEVPVMVQRLCGICPVSHLLAASKAMDVIVGADRLTSTAEKMRRLMHYGQVFQSHALHFFYLAAPDLLLGFESPPAARNIVGLALSEPELARKAVLMRGFGQEVIRVTAGKRIHGTGAVPGGINKNLSTQERDALAPRVDDMISWILDALGLFKKLFRDNEKYFRSFADFESNFLSIVREDGALDLYDGLLRSKDAEGKIIFDKIAPRDYLKVIGEEARSWSYMKFPFILSKGKENGWYRVGPLARINNCDFIDTPLAERERREFMGLGGGRPVHPSLAYHWARLIESVHAVEKIKALLADPDLQGTDLIVTGERRAEGTACIEAPRGTLFHHYRVRPDDTVEMANLIVSTTSNNEAMNRAVQAVARDELSGRKITEGLLNKVEVAIRAYDPCLSCATHALGQMPLVAELMDSKGNLLDRKARTWE